MDISRIVFILITEIIRILIIRRFAITFLNTDEKRIRRVFAYLCSLLITTLEYSLINISWLNLLSTLIGLSIISVTYNGSIKKKALFVFYVLAMSCIIDLLVYSFLSRTIDIKKYFGFGNILELLILLAAQLFTKRIFDKNKSHELESKHWWQYIVSLIVCIATSLVLVIDKTISPLSLLIVCGSFLVVNLIIVYLIDDLINKTKNEINNQILKDQMISYEREISLQNEKAELVRALRHDMKKHLSEIAALSKQNNPDLIEKYIKKFGEELKESALICDSGNPGLDTVLNYMLAKAVDRNITVNSKVTVPKEIELSIYDMNIILGNIIENAIEACVDTPEPRIDLIIKYVKNSIVIELNNNYKNEINMKDGCLLTTKEPKEKHGYGIRNIKNVLNKYPHTLDFDYTPERFTVKILMKIS